MRTFTTVGRGDLLKPSFSSPDWSLGILVPLLTTECSQLSNPISRMSKKKKSGTKMKVLIDMYQNQPPLEKLSGDGLNYSLGRCVAKFRLLDIVTTWAWKSLVVMKIHGTEFVTVMFYLWKKLFRYAEPAPIYFQSSPSPKWFVIPWVGRF